MKAHNTWAVLFNFGATLGLFQLQGVKAELPPVYVITSYNGILA